MDDSRLVSVVRRDDTVNRHGAKSFVLAIIILLPTIFLRVACASTDSENNTTAVLNVKNFSAMGDGKTDDTLAFSNALKSLGERGGTLLVPSGKYVVGGLKIGSGTTLKGLGVPRPILVKSPLAKNILDLTGEMVGGGRRGVHNVTIESLTLRGRSVEDGFKEHIHNVNAMGVKTLIIHNVAFEAFQGDGLYLGSGFSVTDPVAHNSDVIVSDSEFRGVNSENRNGISIIDCDRCIIEHNSFSDLSRADMPGPIDIEPNRLDEIIRNIVVRNNTIKGTNGAAGISIVLRAGVFQHLPGHITLERNSIEHAKIGIHILRRQTASTQAERIAIDVRHNTLLGTNHPLLIDGTSGITIANNVFSDSSSSVEIGCNSRSDFSFIGNRLERIGSQSGNAIELCGQLSFIKFQGNTFIDTGSKATDSSAIYFISGVMNSISIVDNTFSSPHHVTRAAIRLAKTAKFGDNKLVWAGNVLNDGIQQEALQ
jgi:hypothetical protein